MVIKIDGENLDDIDDVGRHLIYGGSGVGKTRFLTSIPLYPLSKKVPPEEIKVIVLDFDKGIRKNLKSYPPSYTRFFEIYMINDMNDVREASELIVAEVEKFIEEYNKKPYLAIDNNAKWWEMSQDDFIQQAYDMNMAERTVVEVRSRILHKQDESVPVVFKSMTEDWQGIKALHKYYRDKIYNCGANLVVTSTAKGLMEKHGGKYEVVESIPGGEKEDREGYPFDFISYMAVSTEKSEVTGLNKVMSETIMHYYMIVTKSRISPKIKKFIDDNINFKNYMEWIEKRIAKNRELFMEQQDDVINAVLSVMNTGGAQLEEDDAVIKAMEDRNRILDDDESETEDISMSEKPNKGGNDDLDDI